MVDSKLFELFPAEYRDLLQQYLSRLSQVFKDYDVVVFMARKAVCFYKALVIGEFISKPYNCEVYSNRILTYNVAEKFNGKKVIVIDDVMIKGKSLVKTLKMIKRFGVQADVCIMARPRLEKGAEDVLAETNVIGTYAEMSEHDTEQLSKHIADFISVSVCPYNIDQPIYAFRDSSDKTINEFAEEHMLIDISSGLQSEYGIKSFVLEILNNSCKNAVLKEKIELCKIRFLYGQYGNAPVFLAIPFVLLKEMSYAELADASDCLNSEQLHNYMFNKNERQFRENQLKTLHYILSAQLMDAFISVCGIKTVHRLNNNDDFVFADNIFLLANVSHNPFEFISLPVNNEVCYDHDFIQNEYLDLSYDFLLSEAMLHNNYVDSDGNSITSDNKATSGLLVLSELKQFISKRINEKFNPLVFSNLIDILIDMGFIIPSIVHGWDEKRIVRAYKCGEVYSLSSKHFTLFAYALKGYLKGIGHDYLFKTEFEKLCVLFFREAINEKILQYKEAKGEKDEYNICFSKFGPRVSTSRPIYSADETSTLAVKLLGLKEIDIEPVTIEGKVSVMDEDAHTGEKPYNMAESKIRVVMRYKVPSLEADKIGNSRWESVADFFAASYTNIYENLFNADSDEISFEDVRNMYMRTYLEFLVMLSIGASKKNQLLSLLAEIYFYDSVVINGTPISSLLRKYIKITDGLISGMWKYMCYSQEKHPIKCLCEALSEDKKGRFLGSQINTVFEADNDIDKNEYIEPLIDDIGMLIFSMVYSLYFMFKKYHVLYMENGEFVNLENKYKREFYYKRFKDLRLAIAAQVQESTMAQDMQTLCGFQSKAKECIERYNTEIDKGKRQAKKKDRKVIKQTFIMKNSNVTVNTFGGEVSGNINSTISMIDTGTLNGLLTTIIEEATKNNISEIAELKVKLDELRKEVTSKSPNKEKVKGFFDWAHKLTAISVALLNLYRFIASCLGLPPPP
jgi:hypothetical protein